MQILANILLAFLIIDALLLVLIVLMQRPKNEGLGAAFGGGVTENIFGAQTTNVLAKFTMYLGIIFFVLALSIAALNARIHSPKSAIQQELLKSGDAAPAKETSSAQTQSANPGAVAQQSGTSAP